MTHRKSLTATFVQKVRTPGKYSDSNGLLLRVYPSGAKCWEQRLTVDRRRRTLGLGGYPAVTLHEARDKALDNLRLARSGEDPIALKRRADVPTVTETFEIVLKTREATWNTPKEPAIWRQRFTTYIAPDVGAHRVSDVTRSDALNVLTPLYKEKTETGRRVRQILRAILDLAVAQGHLASNPAGDVISNVLPKVKKTKTHFPALPHSKVGAALATVRGSTASLPTRLAFEFVVLTATRSGEVRKATWAEIDLETKTWTIPESRMKRGVRHRVPLSPHALSVLEAAKTLDPVNDLVFPSPRGKALSNATLSVCLRKLKMEAVPHGFRSSFRDWCADTGVDATTAEKALAHYGDDPYQRADLLEARRPVMADWAAYVCETAGPLDPSRISDKDRLIHRRAVHRAQRQTTGRRPQKHSPSGQLNLFDAS